MDRSRARSVGAPAASDEGAAVDGRVLFGSALLRVTHRPARSRACVVTFDSYADMAPLERPGFGEAFLADRQLAAIHVVGARNEWYQHDEMMAALAAIRAALRDYERIVTYGSSMGAYAAIRFAAAVGAHVAIALSPQYSVDPRKVPFETRWAGAGAIRFVAELEGPITGAGRTLVFYDPRSPDAKHVELIAAECPVERIRLPYTGHPVASCLAELGVLAPMVVDVVEDRFDGAAFERRVRPLRRRCAKYWDTLARAQAGRRPHAAIAFAREAVARAAADPVYRLTLAELLADAGQLEEAERLQRAALAERPDQPLFLYRTSVVLARRQQYDEAIGLAERAAAMAPGAPQWAAWLEQLRGQASGRPGRRTLPARQQARPARRLGAAIRAWCARLAAS